MSFSSPSSSVIFIFSVSSEIYLRKVHHSWAGPRKGHQNPSWHVWINFESFWPNASGKIRGHVWIGNYGIKITAITTEAVSHNHKRQLINGRVTWPTWQCPNSSKIPFNGSQALTTPRQWLPAQKYCSYLVIIIFILQTIIQAWFLNFYVPPHIPWQDVSHQYQRSRV